LEFSLSGLSGASTLGSSSADLITIDKDGNVTDNGTSATGWALGSFNSGLILCVICPNGVTASATPSQEIIGPGPYGSANGSIAGNGPHNPFLNQSAVFVIQNSSITADTTASDVVFSFGTTFGAEDSTVPGAGGQGGPVPEPATFGLLAGG